MSYPQHIAIATDTMIFRKANNGYELLLIKRKNDPFEWERALPGWFLDNDETLDQAANRELFEETGLENIELMQLYTFSGVERDPRGRVITVVYFALLDESEILSLSSWDDALEAKFFPVNELPSLAFDHDYIVAFAKAHIQELN